MRFVGNLVHLLTGGLVLSLGWFAAAALYCLLPVTRPLALGALQLAFLCLWPDGKRVMRAPEAEALREFLRTGKRPSASLLPCRPTAASVVQMLLWLPAGAPLIVGHLAHGLIAAAPALANPWRMWSVSLLGAAAFPIGWEVAPARPAHRAGGLAASFPWRRRPPRRAPAALGRRATPRTSLAAAGLILWASSAANDAPFSPPRLPTHPPDRRPGQAAWVRPLAIPALPLRDAPLPELQKTECATKVAQIAPLRLARVQSGYPLPLGSRPVKPVHASAAVIRHLQNIQALAASNRHAKAATAGCISAEAERLAKAAPLAAERARARRLAGKAGMDAVLLRVNARLALIGPQRGYSIPLRNLMSAQKWARSMSKAKAPGAPDMAEMAERVARTGTTQVIVASDSSVR